MKTKESYNIFIKNCKLKIDKYNKELHNLINIASTFKTLLDSSNNEILENYFKDIAFLDEVKTIPKLDYRLESIFKCYKSYTNYRIPFLKKMLKLYNLMSIIPYENYYDIVLNYNMNLSYNLLQGHTITINRIGKLTIEYREKRCNRLILDQKKTKEIKEKYKQENINKDYRVFNTNDTYLYFSFYKFKRVKNYEYYHFEPTNYNNTDDRKIENYYKTKKTIDDIILNTKLGNLQKANSILKQDNMYKLKYIQNAN
jgi:nucleoid DNA-binding protein